MKDIAESKFWKFIALALVAGIFYLGWAISGGRAPSIGIREARAQAVIRLEALDQDQYVLVPSEKGDTLYAYQFQSTPTNAPPKLRATYSFRVE